MIFQQEARIIKESILEIRNLSETTKAFKVSPSYVSNFSQTFTDKDEQPSYLSGQAAPRNNPGELDTIC